MEFLLLLFGRALFFLAELLRNTIGLHALWESRSPSLIKGEGTDRPSNHSGLLF